MQRVVINGKQSEWIFIKAGVPQGSILGSLLFLIYVNDIIESIESDIYLIADDTSVTTPIRDPKLTFDMLNRDLERLDTWSKKWLMQFNPG